MVRAAVFAIVLSLSGPSTADVVCGLFCQQHAGSTAHHAHGQDEPSGRTSARMTPAHTCDHLTPVTPFLLQPPTVLTLQAAADVVPGVAGFASERFPDFTTWSTPPGGGGVVLRSRSPILRI